MKKYRRLFGIILFTILIIPQLYGQNTFPVLRGPYFGQKAPVEKAEVFLDGIISTIQDPEMCAAFAKDGREFYYNAIFKNNWTIFSTKIVDGKWTKPEPMDFTSGYTDRDFTISPDGNKIHFGSNRPRYKGDDVLTSLDIFMTERIQGDRWAEPKNVGSPINTDHGENYPSMAQNGNLYFFSNRNDGLGGCDIYVSRFVNGRYTQSANLGHAVNSAKNDWDAFIAPDERYIIFSSQNRDDTIGGQDLYISYRKSDGAWTQAKNMGTDVNSQFAEICPSVSLDGQYLFFTSRRRGKADIYWISTEILQRSYRD